ncbi:MAG: T9SS type A sorting domain-containing protein, partial [Bacteroidota bacterium]
KEYLHQGGHLFVSGSEIGWDLSAKGSAADKEFYSSYLKALYKSDDAGSGNVAGAGSPIFTKCSFTIGQAYEEDFPDEIDTAGGSTICFRYGNQKVAGICYSGIFGPGIKPGGIIYLAFPLETAASDSGFRNVVDAAMEYFDPLSPVEQRSFAAIKDFSLSQNYPNPFNPATMIKYRLPMNNFVTLKVFDIVGREVATLVNENLTAGVHEVQFNASNLSSGLYFYTLQAGKYSAAKKMILMK